jgi:hypothetical protein
LPGQALDIIKTLTTDLRIQCLQVKNYFYFLFN